MTYHGHKYMYRPLMGCLHYMCTYFFNILHPFYNSVDPDQLASDEAS